MALSFILLDCREYSVTASVIPTITATIEVTPVVASVIFLCTSLVVTDCSSTAEAIEVVTSLICVIFSMNLLVHLLHS